MERWGARRHADLSEMWQFFWSESSRLTAESQSRGPVLVVPKAGVQLIPDGPPLLCSYVDAESVLGKRSWDTPVGYLARTLHLPKGHQD